MEFDRTIAQLGAKLDAWFDSNQAIFESEDTAAHSEALLGGSKSLPNSTE